MKNDIELIEPNPCRERSNLYRRSFYLRLCEIDISVNSFYTHREIAIGEADLTLQNFFPLVSIVADARVLIKCSEALLSEMIKKYCAEVSINLECSRCPGSVSMIINLSKHDFEDYFLSRDFVTLLKENGIYK